MVIWSTIEASCPLCGNRLRLREVGGGFAIGQDSDLFVRMRGKHVIQAEVHTCHRCRFSGYCDDFQRDVSEAAKQRYLEEIAPHLVEDDDGARSTTRSLRERVLPSKGASSKTGPKSETRPRAKRRGESAPQRCRRTPLPHVQYYWAYRAAEALELSAHEQGQRLLRAYWCLRVAPSANLAERRLKRLRKRYLTEAIRKFRQDLRHQKDPHVLFLVGELCRRNSNFVLATSYFRRFLERSPRDTRGYLRQAAEKLFLVAKERIATELTMEEILYDPAPESED